MSINFSPVSGERGSILSILMTLVLVVVLAAVLLFYVFGQIVLPNQIGLRQNFFNIPGVLQSGYSEQGLLPGLHWKIPGISTIHLLRRDFQIVNFDERLAYGDLDLGALEIPTTDGSKVRTDVTLILRLFEREERAKEAPQRPIDADDDKVPLAHAQERPHGGPAQLVNRYRFKPQEQLMTFSLTAEEALKNTLSTLSTTDYYNPVPREKAALAANDMISNEVNQDGIDLWATLIRRYVYSERNIDDQIFNKNLQEQTELLNAAERALEEARAKTETTKANWDAQIADLLVGGEQQQQVIISEANRYEVEKKSLGDRAVQEALATVDKAKNQILTDTPGAEVYVAREMAPLIGTLKGGVVTGIDPFDVDAWVNKLIPTSASSRRAPPNSANGSDRGAPR